MRRWGRGACVAWTLLAGTAVLAGAEDAAVDLTPAPAWGVGDVLARSEDVQVEIRDHVGGKGYSSGSTKNAIRISAAWLERCEEATEGRRTAYVAWVTTWKRTQNETEDTSLQGRWVRVRGEGDARAWTLLGEPQKVASGAQEWLDSSFGPGGRDDPVRALLPEEPRTAGAAWKPEWPRVAAIALGGEDNVDATRAAGDVTLRALAAGRATVAWDLSAPWPSMPVQGGPPWTKGGVWHLRGEAQVLADGRVGCAEEAWTIDLEGEGEAKPKSGDSGPLVYAMKLGFQVKRTRRLGGEWKDPPPAPPR